jgi:ribosomal protein S4
MLHGQKMKKKRVNSNGVYVYPCEHDRVDYKALEKLCKMQQKELIAKDKDINQLLEINKKQFKKIQKLHQIIKEVMRRNNELVEHIKIERMIIH